MNFKCLRCKSELDPAYKACPHCGEPVTDFLRQHSNTPIDGKYRILERLGAGGMGEVYKVEHTFLGATRVIKVIRPQISGSQDAHERFLREARVATKVQHPNVATLHDFSALPDGSHYMVWEFIEGENLAQRLRIFGTLPPRQAVELTIEALHGLEAIHRAGIVHRDISPENLMITRDSHGVERVKIIDLGVAKDEDAGDGGTRAGIFVGKLRYASPEQIGFLEEGEKIDGRADLYSMALVLYEMLAGRPPYEAKSPHEYVLLHSRETAIRPLDLDAMPGGIELRKVVELALSRDRNKRFQSAREFSAALEQVHHSLPDLPAAGRFDGDATMRVTPVPGSFTQQTVRSGTMAVAPAAETIRTPLPQAAPAPPPPAAPTLLTPLPGATPPPSGGGTNRVLLIVAILFAIVALAAIAALVFMRRGPAPLPAATATTAAVTPTSTAPPPSGSFDVVSPTATETTAATATTIIPTATTPTVAPAAPPPPQTQTHAPEQHTVSAEPPPPPVEERRPASNVRAYVDGDGGDSEENEQAMAAAQRELSGVTRVAVRGGSAPELAMVLRRELGDLTIADEADVVIDFTGNLERLGRGRKRRSGEATITKHGRTVFRYQMPAEEYRVGDAPAEAFARILAEAFGR